MIAKEIAERVQNATDALGVPIPIPKPTVKGQKITGTISSTIGVGTLVAGVALKNKWSILGGLAIVAGGIITYLDAKNE